MEKSCRHRSVNWAHRTGTLWRRASTIHLAYIEDRDYIGTYIGSRSAIQSSICSALSAIWQQGRQVRRFYAFPLVSVESRGLVLPPKSEPESKNILITSRLSAVVQLQTIYTDLSAPFRLEKIYFVLDSPHVTIVRERQKGWPWSWWPSINGLLCT